MPHLQRLHYGLCVVCLLLACGSKEESIGACPRGASEQGLPDIFGRGICYAATPTTSCAKDQSCTTCVYGQACSGGSIAGQRFYSCDCSAGMWQCSLTSQDASGCPPLEAGAKDASDGAPKVSDGSVMTE
jgi:hypothetical protein